MYIYVYYNNHNKVGLPGAERRPVRLAPGISYGQFS